MSVIIFVLIIFGPLNIGLFLIPIFAGYMWKAWLQKFHERYAFGFLYALPNR